jgi:hypothetical protein
MYFNLLTVVVLAEPAEQFSTTPSQVAPEAFRVDKVREYEEGSGPEEAEKEDEVGDEAEELNEATL